MNIVDDFWSKDAVFFFSAGDVRPNKSLVLLFL